MSYSNQVVRLPEWPAPPVLRMSTGPYGDRACQCDGGCGGRCTDLAPLGGLGLVLPSPGLSIGTIVVVAAVGYLGYKFIFQDKKKARARALRAATSRYKSQQAAIRARYA